MNNPLNELKDKAKELSESKGHDIRGNWTDFNPHSSCNSCLNCCKLVLIDTYPNPKGNMCGAAITSVCKR